MTSSFIPTSLPHPALALGYRSDKQFNNIEERITNAMKIMAQVIVEEGEEYLPIFLRLENELEIYLAKKKSLQNALYLAQENRIK